MDRNNRGELTPSRKGEAQREEETGKKLKMKEALVQSKYELNETARDDQDRNSKLQEYEDQIKKCQKRLAEIRNEQLRETDKYSDKFLDLEHERTQLKKRVIDLDYQHRVQFANNMRESRRKENEQKERMIKQAEQQKQRRKQELDDRLAEQREQRQKRRQQRQRSSQKKQQDNTQEQDQGQQQGRGQQDKKQATEQQKLDQSRRKLRIAQIQAELAQSRLRRSRMASLNAQLDYLRASYSYPLWTWRDYYPYSYSLYPYTYSSLYPYTSPLTSPYLYPYTSSYLYPYTSSYIYPLRYSRWWY